MTKVLWEDLSTATANILERCWSLNHYRPTTFEVKLGTMLYSQEDIVTMENFEEILSFQQSDPHFNVMLLDFTGGHQVIKVTGAYDFHEWDDFDHALTENGAKEELAINDAVYVQYSHDIANISMCRIRKVTKKEYVLNNGIRIAKEDFTIQNSTVVIRLKDTNGQVFVSRESVHLKQANERAQLEEQFTELFDIKSISNDTLLKLIAVLEEND